MFFDTPESWIFLLVTCFIGFLIGQWIKARRKKTMTNDDYVNGLKKRILVETLAQKKNLKRKREGPIKRKVVCKVHYHCNSIGV